MPDAATGGASAAANPSPRAGIFARAAAAARTHAWALLVILVVAAAPFATAAIQGRTPFFLDLEDHWYPFRLHAFRAREQGEVAQWCRHAFCGFPFAAQLEAALAYPPHWVLDLFHPAKTLLAQVVGHRFVLGALVYAILVARGATRTAACLGGALAVASGIAMSCFSQPAALRTIAWTPLVLFGIVRICAGRRREGMLWTALGTGLACVAGYPPFLQRAALAIPFVLLLDPAPPRGADAWIERTMRFAYAAGGAALGCALAAAQILPAKLLTGQSQRQLGLDPALLDGLRVEPLDALMMLVPRVDRDGGVVKQGFAYLGLLPLALAAFAVLRRRPGALAFGCAALAALVASMGRAVPVVGSFLASIPVVNSFRNPSQYLLAWVLVVPVLAAMGLDAVRERRPTARELAASFGAVLVLALVAVGVPSWLSDPASQRRAVVAIAALAAGAWLATRTSRRAPAAIVAACLADAATFQFNYPTREGRAKPVAEVMEPSAPFALVARRHLETGRPGAPRAITSEAAYNWENHGFAAGVDNVRGVISLLPMHALDLNRIVEKGAPFERRPPDEPLYAYGPTKALASPRIDLLALGYAIGFERQPGPEWRPVPGGERWHVWERDPVPEARLVKRFVPTEDPAAALVAPGFDPRTDAVCEPLGELDDDAPTDGPPPGTVTIDRIGVNEVRMHADASRPALLVWSETRDAGWVCTGPDGREREILAANYAHMAVTVPKGRTDLVWTYVAPGWRMGVTISIAAVVLFLVLAVRTSRVRA